ncbi:hypothetical protein B9G69_015060 [Bdellovibrio sp. SKB1291214]|uniref:spermine/spermidine synthase domain-containing protein n=1 Tax=Bdellovibrio sp. SKB1291214 TaxID=1732569 RepID=UPI000B5183F8|nr:hypothetical protein [Bdellovibrio sp. SKB1291214]UYL08360.1 hypothetical protein B9G69_015060 [Bdellovibrio sp. SKB1291214]
MVLSLVALASGLLNLSSQVLYQKIVSMTLGDLYITFLLVTLTFIFGTALGSLIGFKVRRLLPWVEILTGFYNLALFFLLSTEFYKIQPPQFLVVIGLLVPAVSLGVQLPLYSYYLRRIRFNFIYGLYHGGAILGLLAFEVYFTQGLSVKYATLTLALGQISLGLILGFLLKHDIFQISQSPRGVWRTLFKRGIVEIPFSVFLISLLSSYQIFWALKTQIFLTEAFRLHATLISAAVFFWMTVAGLSEKYLHQISRSILYFAWGFIILITQIAFATWPSFVTDQFTGELPNYFIWSSVLALSLTLPVLISSLVFIKSTQELAHSIAIDQSSGYLNALACLGNILGMTAAALMAPLLWSNLYFASALALLIAGIVTLTYFNKRYSESSWGFGLLALLALIAFQQNPTDNLFKNRFEKKNRENPIHAQVYSEAFSTIAVLEDPFTPNGKLSRHYIIDGHRSHDLERGTENLIGLFPRKYFPSTLNKSMVIGVGTGQTSWGVSAISEHTDLIEISPTVLDNLKLFKEYNNDLANRKNIAIHLTDGMTFLKNCPAHTYDLIVNTATYPGNFNAAKLYTTEFVELAARCLGDTGIYQTYFDDSTVQSWEQLANFLAPLQAHFKHIDIISGNYPIVMAYNTERSLSQGSWEEFLTELDLKFYKENLQSKIVFNLECNDIQRNIPIYPDGEMNTLDKSVLEATSIRNIIRQTYQRKYYLFADYAKLQTPVSCF